MKRKKSRRKTGILIGLILLGVCLSVNPSVRYEKEEESPSESSFAEERGLEALYISFLSRGAYAEGEAAFLELEKNEKNPGELAFLKRAVEDLALLSAGSEAEPVLADSFETPEAAASAVCFSSAGEKLLKLVDEDSELLPKASGNVGLRECLQNHEEKRRRLEERNRTLPAGHGFLDVAVFRADLFGAPYEIQVMMEGENFRWKTVSLKRMDHPGGMTVARAKEQLAGDPSFDPEEWFLPTE